MPSDTKPDDELPTAKDPEKPDHDDDAAPVSLQLRKVWITSIANFLTAAILPAAVAIYQSCAKAQDAAKAQTDKDRAQQADTQKAQAQWAEDDRQKKQELLVTLAGKVFGKDGDLKNCDLALNTWHMTYPDDGDKVAPIASACASVGVQTAPAPPLEEWSIVIGTDLDAKSGCNEAEHVSAVLRTAHVTEPKVLLYKNAHRYLTVVAGYLGKSAADLGAIELRTLIRPGVVERLSQATAGATLQMCPPTG